MVIPLIPSDTEYGNVNSGVCENNDDKSLCIAGCHKQLNQTFCEQCSSGRFYNLTEVTTQSGSYFITRCPKCETGCKKCD